MLNISIVELVIIAFVIFITIFAVVDRICKCVESVKSAKVIGEIKSPEMIGCLQDYIRKNIK